MDVKAQEKAKEIAKKYEQYGCECIPHDCEEAAMQMHEWTKKQYISAAFIRKVLKMTSEYPERRNLSAVATHIASELKKENSK